MKITRKDLDELYYVYAVMTEPTPFGEQAFFSSEKNAPCVRYSVDRLAPKAYETVWTAPGGAVSFAAIPNGRGEFLSISNFRGLVDWENAEVIWAWPEADGSYRTKSLRTIAYLHRIDVVTTDRGTFFIGCNLADHKSAVEDWHSAGHLYVGELDLENREIVNWRDLRDDLFQNHGYAKYDGFSMIGCQNGIFSLRAPQGDHDWRFVPFAPMSVSDMAVCDIDGDGEMELATIEPFHGDTFRVYKKCGSQWTVVYECPKGNTFYHVIWGGKLNGKPCFLGGARGGNRELFRLRWQNGQIVEETIDRGAGPSNICVWHDRLLVPNYETHTISVYDIEEEEDR